MSNKKLTLIIVGTLLAMALVAACLVLWLLPANKAEVPENTGNGAVTENQSGEQNDATVPGESGNNSEDNAGDNSDEPTVDVEVPGENSGNTGSNGNEGSGGNGGNSGNAEIDFDDLLGN